MKSISERLHQPTSAEVRQARERAKLTQTDAAKLVSPSKTKPYRTWQNYEIEAGQKGHRTIPLATWELFLLITDQHPTHRMVTCDASPTEESG